MKPARRAILALAFLGAACARGVQPPALSPLPFPADTVRSQVVSDGVVHRYIYSSKGPWAINTLEVDLDRCNAAIAVKGAESAAGRIKTTVMLADLAKREKVLGGVNADFFSLANGTPTNLLVVNGRMLTPPSAQPVLAFDSAGMPHIGRFTLNGSTLSPFYPREAVGGRPILARDSVILAAADTFGQASFIARNPRTAAGYSRGGKHLILAVIDGRQKPFSDGTSLRETAEIMLALGARDVINLDGGGSSVLVYADPDSSGALRIANRPSDKVERAVGDALAIVKRCR
jgi:exopolysaccharide biosynthesis protein